VPYLIDTNVAIHLRDRDPAIRSKVQALGDGILLSVISRVELEGGVYNDPSKAASRRVGLDLVLASVLVVPFDDVAAATYGSIVAALGFSRRKLIDRMIAAQALINGATLVTMNPGDFNDVPGLQVMAW
jgi:tRNA(fMet)-specific endonuclease VapC